jgi:hypothetical protein
MWKKVSKCRTITVNMLEAYQIVGLWPPEVLYSLQRLEITLWPRCPTNEKALSWVQESNWQLTFMHFLALFGAVRYFWKFVYRIAFRKRQKCRKFSRKFWNTSIALSFALHTQHHNKFCEFITQLVYKVCSTKVSMNSGVTFMKKYWQILSSKCNISIERRWHFALGLPMNGVDGERSTHE